MLFNGDKESRGNAEASIHIRGTFFIKKKLSQIDFVLQLDMYGTEKSVQHNKLKPYEGNNPLGWMCETKTKKRLSNHREVKQ